MIECHFVCVFYIESMRSSLKILHVESELQISHSEQDGFFSAQRPRLVSSTSVVLVSLNCIFITRSECVFRGARAGLLQVSCREAGGTSRTTRLNSCSSSPPADFRSETGCNPDSMLHDQPPVPNEPCSVSQVCSWNLDSAARVLQAGWLALRFQHHARRDSSPTAASPNLRDDTQLLPPGRESPSASGPPLPSTQDPHTPYWTSASSAVTLNVWI